MRLTLADERILLEILDSHSKECRRMECEMAISDEHFTQVRDEVVNGSISPNGAHYLRVVIMNKNHSYQHTLFSLLGILCSYELVDYGD